MYPHPKRHTLPALSSPRLPPTPSPFPPTQQHLAKELSGLTLSTHLTRDVLVVGLGGIPLFLTFILILKYRKKDKE